MTCRILNKAIIPGITIFGFVIAPASSAEQIEKHELENARIVVQENLQELPDVTVTTKEDSLAASATDTETTSTSPESTTEEAVGPTGDSRFEIPSITEKVLRTTDEVMEAARLPLTYIQEHVPFLTKRDTIFFGRLELDAATYSKGILKSDNGFQIRRLRLGVAGLFRFIPGWNYKFEIDLTDGENSLSDAYLYRRSDNWGTFRIGNQKVAQTLSGQTSSLSNTFMERPLPVLAFTLERRAGVGWDIHLRRQGANVTVFAGDPNKKSGSSGWAARAYVNPTRDRFQVLHMAVSYMELESDEEARQWARPESDVTSTRLVDTGIQASVDSSSALGLELAGSRGSMTFKSEYYVTQWSRAKPEKSLTFNGWYAEASWFLTGELALYRDGKFIRPNIRGRNGAWEVAVRASSTDLKDRDIQGGKEKNLTFGINWYSKTHWRFMANLIRVKAYDGAFGKQEPWIAQFRAQYYF